MFTETREGFPVSSPALLSLQRVESQCLGLHVVIPREALPLLLVGSSDFWPLPHLEESSLSLSLSLQNSSKEFWLGENSSQEGRCVYQQL